jgi:hypothetical protein
MALRFSKKIGSPGIIVDPEAYNNYGVYNTKNLEKLMQQPSFMVSIYKAWIVYNLYYRGNT